MAKRPRHPQLGDFLEEQFRVTRNPIGWAMVIGASVLILRGFVDMKNHAAAPPAIEMGWRVGMALVLSVFIVSYRKANSLLLAYRLMSAYVVLLVFGICGTLHLHVEGRAAYTLMPLTLIYLIVAAVWPQTRWMVLTLFFSSLVILELFFHHILLPHDQMTYVFYLMVGTALGLVLRQGRAQTAFDNFLMRRHLTAQAMSDPLTGVLNRSGWETHLLGVMRGGSPMRPSCLLFFDIDHFKNVNDTHGHAIGDVLIKKTASILTSLLRDTDVLARFGGEEFVVFLPGTAVEGALLVAERIRQRVEENIDPVQVTASMGLASFLPGESVADATDRADKAMLQAKQAGRNRIVLAPEKYQGS